MDVFLREWSKEPIDAFSFSRYAIINNLEIWRGEQVTRLKKNIPHTLLYPLALGVCFLLFLLSGFVLFIFSTPPKQNIPYDLPLFFTAEAAATLCFGAGIFLLIISSWRFFFGKVDWSPLFLSITAFLSSICQIASVGKIQFDILPMDLSSLSRLLSLSVLLLFLTGHMSRTRQLVFSVLTVLQMIATALCAVPDIDERTGFLWQNIPEWIGLITLAGILVCAIWKWKKENRFFYLFRLFALTGLAIFIILLTVFPVLRHEMAQQFSAGSQGYFLRKLMLLTMISTILSTITEMVLEETARQTEIKLLAQQYHLAQSSFENLRCHYEEVMMLRHDMKKHLTFLRKTTSDEATARYLDELLGQQQTLSPVIQSRNPSMDIILNAKLNEAAEKKIAVEIIRSDVPKSLPLSDTELCSLLMNLLDNSISAASAADKPYIRLDMHQKDGFFVFMCENSALPEQPKQTIKKETMQKHGFGRKIIRRIISHHGNLIKEERLPDSYRVIIALPLDHPCR